MCVVQYLFYKLLKKELKRPPPSGLSALHAEIHREGDFAAAMLIAFRELESFRSSREGACMQRAVALRAVSQSLSGEWGSGARQELLRCVLWHTHSPHVYVGYADMEHGTHNWVASSMLGKKSTERPDPLTRGLEYSKACYASVVSSKRRVFTISHTS